MLTAEGLRFSYGRAPVLRSFSFSVGPGELQVLAGENGSGKSTALRLMAGVLRPEAGTLRKTGTLAYVPQRPQLLEDLSGRENLAFFAALAGKKPPRQPALGVAAFQGTRVARLSGGMKQRLSLACALAMEPGLLLLDEPMEALDREGKDAFRDLLRSLLAYGVGVVYVGHDPEEYRRDYTGLTYLRDGVSQCYARDQLSGREEEEKQRARLGENLDLLARGREPLPL